MFTVLCIIIKFMALSHGKRESFSREEVTVSILTLDCIIYISLMKDKIPWITTISSAPFSDEEWIQDKIFFTTLFPVSGWDFLNNFCSFETCFKIRTIAIFTYFFLSFAAIPIGRKFVERDGIRSFLPFNIISLLWGRKTWYKVFAYFRYIAFLEWFKCKKKSMWLKNPREEFLWLNFA